MDSMLYYEICFFISVILSFIYICVWHEGIDVNMTCLFILIPIVCLGCVWMYWAPTPEIAVLSNKIVYLAGCFWPLMATKAILSVCNLKIKKWMTVVAFSISFIFYFFALQTEKNGPIYTALNIVDVGGRYALFPEYGWMHTVIYIAMALYCIIGVYVLIYSMKNKFRASIHNMWVMLAGEVITVIVFFIYGLRNLAGSPAILYVSSQAVFLIAGYRSYYYDIDSSVMDTLVTEGKLGYVTFDTKKCLLGCNQVAEELFPELKTTRTDKNLDNYDGIKQVMNECMLSIEKDKQPVEIIVPCGEKFIKINADLHMLHGGKQSYRFIMEDDTDHQKYIKLLNQEKEEAISESKHVSDTLNRYIDPNIASKILKDGGTELSIGKESNIAVLFADIRGFTTYSENKTPREVLNILNKAIEAMTSCVMDNNGAVDKIIGDCVMAVWDSKDGKKSVYNACKAALEMQKEMNKIGDETEKESGVHLHVGVGINYGLAIVGNVGTAKRSDYTAIGDTVNVASRLEGVAAPDEILCTSIIADMLKEKATFSQHNRNIVLKGRSSETTILRLENIK